MAEELTEVERQVLSAVRDEGLPTNTVALTQHTGFDEDVVRQALESLGGTHLRIEPRDDGLSRRIEVVAFLGDGGVARELVDDEQPPQP